MLPQTKIKFKKTFLNIRIYKFALIGLSGVFINLGMTRICYGWIFYSLQEVTRVQLSYLCGILISILSNFLLNDSWTWRDKKSTHSALRFRMIKFYVVSLSAALIQFSVSSLCTFMLEMHFQIGQLFGIASGFCLNFFANHFWTYRRENEDRAQIMDPKS